MLDLLRFAVGVAVLGYAAYSDIKERAVYSFVWIIMATAGYALTVYEYAGNLYTLLTFAAAAIVFYQWYFDDLSLNVKIVIYFISFVLAVGGITLGFTDHATWLGLATYAVTVLVIGLRHRGIIKGRADARAVMAIAALHPAYPAVQQFMNLSPLARSIAEVTMPFALLVLFYAAVSALSVPLYLGIRNGLRGDAGFPEMFIGYRMPLRKVPQSYVWLMERVEGNDIVMHLRPTPVKDVWDEIAKLEAKGRKDVWVQPKVPFVVFIFIGYLLAFFVGYPLAFLTA